MHHCRQRLDRRRPLASVTSPPRPPVRGLLFRGRPTAIAGLIVPIVVDAVDRMLIRARPHVGKEAFKAGQATLTAAPAGTDRDAATAVVGEMIAVPIGAASHHAAPRDIFRAAGHSVRAEGALA